MSARLLAVLLTCVVFITFVVSDNVKQQNDSVSTSIIPLDVTTEQNHLFDDIFLRQGQGRGQTDFLKKFLKLIWRSVNDLYGSLSSLINHNATYEDGGQCLRDLEHYSAALQYRSSWALQMADATGRFGPGMLKGNFELLGDLDQCLAIKEELPGGHVIEGNECVVGVPIPRSVYDKANIPQNLRLSAWIPYHFVWHLCVPKSCVQANLTRFLKSAFQYGTRIDWVKCKRERETILDASTIVAICICSLIVTLNLVGTVYDAYTKINNRSKLRGLRERDAKEAQAAIERGFYYGHELSLPYEKEMRRGIGHNFLLSFSVLRNKRKMFSAHPEASNLSRLHRNQGPSESSILKKVGVTETSSCHDNRSFKNDLSCIHGIRVISMGWIILVHTITVTTIGARNIMDVIRSLGRPEIEAVINNAVLAVDTFFLLSGCLVSYVFLRESQRRGHISCRLILNYYFHRWWRLTPLYMAVILVVIVASSLLRNSLQEFSFVSVDNCKQNWWVNILYINNIYRNTNDQICLDQTWFLSADMQFHWIAPLALIPLSTGWVFIGFLVVAGLICTHILTATVFAYLTKGTILLNNTEHQTQYYFQPYCRVGVFAIGIALAYVLHKRKTWFLKSRIRRILGWTTAVGICVTCTFYTTGQYSEGVDTWTRVERVAHEVISRPAWACALSWIIYACCSGYGGWLNAALSWYVWRPLGRLTYGAFLLHIAVLSMTRNYTRTHQYVSLQTIIHNYIVTWVISYGLAFVFSVLVEWPCMAIEKVFKRRND